MITYNLVIFTNLVLVFTCKFLHNTYANSRDENWKGYKVNNDVKYVLTAILAVLMKVRSMVLNTLDLLTLFEMIALSMVIRREKGKSLDHLLF